MTRAFASAGDLAEKAVSFAERGPGPQASTAGGGPTPGVVVGEAVMVVEAQATPRLARAAIERVRGVADKPVAHLAPTRDHPARVPGA